MEKENRVNIPKEERERIVDAIRNSTDHIEECEMYSILFNTDDCDGLTCRDCRMSVNKKLAALIETATAQPDGIPYPLDKDGVPIKLGDTVYYDGGEFKVDSIKIEKSCISDNLCYRIIGLGEYRSFNLMPDMITHTNPRTLEDIIGDIMYSMEDGACDDTEKDVNELVHEAYEMGRKAAKDE